MIRHLERSAIDTAKWDACIRASAQGQVFALSWYLDTCAPGWSALVLDDYAAVFPLSIRTKVGIRYAVQPFFTRHFGLYVREGDFTQLTADFFKAIPGNIRYFDFCLHAAHTTGPEGFTTTEKRHQQLSLTSDYSVLRDRYNENCARSVRKAEKAGLQLLHNYDPAEVTRLFRMHTGEKELGFSEENFTTLATLMHTAVAHTPTLCLGVSDATGQIVAGGFFMESHGRILYLKGFSTPEGRKTGAMHFLFDQLIRSKAGSDSSLDFGGSNDEGVSRFYKGFGSVDCLYLHLHRNRLPRLLRLIKR